MRLSWKQAWSALALTAAAIWVMPDEALSGGNAPLPKKAGAGANDGMNSDNTTMRIPANSVFPLSRQINMGGGRSMMIQFPMELRDVMISDPEKVDIILQTSNRVFLVAKKPGAANAFFFDTQGNQIATFEINIGSDLTSLDQLLKRLIPGSNVKSELAGATIVLTGTVRSPIDSQRASDLAKQYAAANKGAIGAGGFTSTSTTVGNVTTWQTQSQSSTAAEYKPVINMLSVEADEQVMLKVTVAEVNRTILKQFGINLANSINSGNFSLGAGTNNALPITATALGGGLPIAGLRHLASPAGAGGCGAVLPSDGSAFLPQSGLVGGFSAGNSCFSAVMRAFERDGLVRTLAEPTLTAVSGESAKFLAGGEYPVPAAASAGAGGGTAFGITFKEFGVAVAFTPQVLSEGRISLKIDTSVSELSNEGAIALFGSQIPSLRKRSATSTVELPSGGSMALAGLISDTTRQNIDGMPGLKDVPILGTLFRSRDFLQNETELVVMVTPYLVRPTARQNLSRPDDGLAAASDLKGNFLGQINRVYGRGKPIPDGDLKGSHGFIVD
jgi:pilus assembly protein CpaC